MIKNVLMNCNFSSYSNVPPTKTIFMSEYALCSSYHSTSGLTTHTVTETQVTTSNKDKSTYSTPSLA